MFGFDSLNARLSRVSRRRIACANRADRGRRVAVLAIRVHDLHIDRSAPSTAIDEPRKASAGPLLTCDTMERAERGKAERNCAALAFGSLYAAQLRGVCQSAPRGGDCRPPPKRGAVKRQNPCGSKPGDKKAEPSDDGEEGGKRGPGTKARSEPREAHERGALTARRRRARPHARL